MLAVEGALARAEASVGVIPEAAAKVITEVADSLEIEPADLAEGTARDGIPVPALVAAMRKAVTAAGGLDAAQYGHWGATTQDSMDPGQAHALRVAHELQKVTRSVTRGRRANQAG